jgi:hypothetical protein
MYTGLPFLKRAIEGDDGGYSAKNGPQVSDRGFVPASEHRGSFRGAHRMFER